MELQFQSTPLRCLRFSAADMEQTEQTLELRIRQDQPPIGRVLGAWGQPLVRGKEWRADHIRVNGGVMTRVLYEAEEGTGVSCVEGWIPFQLRWELNDSHSDGKVLVSCCLKSLDARQIGAEKLMLRTTVSAYAQALERESCSVYEPGELPKDVQLLYQKYPLNLCVEAGETALSMEEELILPPGKADVDQILFFSLSPSVTDQKIMADKMVFRGTAALHVGYLGTDGMIHAYDTELPISQFAELEQEYGPDASVFVLPMVSDLELERLEDGRIRLKSGLVGQYLICDQKVVSAVTDAYSVKRSVELAMEQVKLPAVLDAWTQTVPIEASAEESADRIVNSTLYAGQPFVRMEDGSGVASLEGGAQVLFYDPEGRLQNAAIPLEGSADFSADNSVRLMAGLLEGGKTETSINGETMTVQAEPGLWMRAVQQDGISMVTGLTLGDEVAPNPNRPTLILRRAGDLSLWQLAKKCGASVEAIKEANGLEGEPDSDRMLLIPVS